MNRPFLVGVTGGTGSGKSLFCRFLAESRGCPVIEADALGHQALLAGSGVDQRVRERFGPSILDSAGQIDRAALARRVFASPDDLAGLNRLVHPWILERILERIAALLAAGYAGIILLDAALLPDWIDALRPDAVVLVRAPVALRLERLGAKGIDRTEAARRVQAQERLDPERERPGWIRVDNDGTPAGLRRAAETTYDRLEELRRVLERNGTR